MTSKWKIKISLLLNYFIFAILLNSVGTIILEVITHYQVSKSSAGNLDAFKDISIAIFSFAAASFLPRLGYKKSMLIGLTLISITCILAPIINTYLMIKLLLISVGVGFALIKVSAYSTVGLITSNERQHASFISIMEGTFMFGVLSGFWLFSFFVKSTTVRWIDTYWVIAALAIIALALLAIAPLDESGITIKGSRVKDDFIAMLKLNKEFFVMIFVVSIFMYVFIEQGITTWLPTFNNKVLHISTAKSIQIASIFSATLGIGRFLAGIILRKMDWFWLLIACCICSIVMVLIALPYKAPQTAEQISSWAQVPWEAYVFPLIGIFLAPIYPTLCSTTVSTTPRHRQSAMMGLIMIFSALGGTLGSKLVGVTFEYLGGHDAISATLIPLTLLIFLLPTYRYFRKHHSNLNAKDSK